MHRTVLYVHGKGGSAAESERYKPLFPDDTVVGLDHGEVPRFTKTTLETDGIILN